MVVSRRRLIDTASLEERLGIEAQRLRTETPRPRARAPYPQGSYGLNRLTGERVAAVAGLRAPT